MIKSTILNNRTTNLAMQIINNKFIHKLKINLIKTIVKNRSHFMKTFKNQINSRSNKI